MRRPPITAVSRLDVFVAVVVFLVLFSSTLLLCDVAKPTPASGDDWVALIDRIIAVPIRLTDVSDLRWYASAVGLAILLSVFALRKTPKLDAAPEADVPSSTRGGFIIAYGPELLAAFTLVWACGSALYNQTWELSRGYIFFLTMGIGWMLALVRVLREAPGAAVLKSAWLIVVLACILSIWHLYALGARFFQLPVGPVTVTACYGAFWATFGIVWLSERWFGGEHPEKPGVAGALCAVVAVILALWLLYEARRRGAILGLIGACAFIACAVLWIRRPIRYARTLVAFLAVVAVIGAVAFIWQQSISSKRVASIPLKVRYTYYETMARMLPSAPLFGYGPDMFVCEMTTKLAPVRAEMPHILHGGLDADAHNEWFQAVFELGIPGGLAYTAIPVLVVLLCLRRWSVDSDAARRRLLLAGSGGLLCLFINELSSINLRSPSVTVWYWTLLGVLIAALRRTEPPQSKTQASSRRLPLRIGAVLLTLGILWICYTDIARARAHGMGRATMYSDPASALKQLNDSAGRFGVLRWLSIRNYRGTALTNHLADRLKASSTTTQPSVESGVQEIANEAIAEWTALYSRCPAYLKTGFQLAQTQNLAGDTAGAIATLRRYLDDIHPYEKETNLLLIRIGGLTHAEALSRLLCAIKWERWDTEMLQLSQQLLSTDSIAAEWPIRVDGARADVRRGDEDHWKDRRAIEVLRMEAFRLISQGDLAGAEQTQREAASAIKSLADRDSRFRRPAAAEADTWYLTARFIFDLNAANYKEAYRRIEQAERYAVRDLVKDEVEDPPLGAPHVGGVVIPVDPPLQLRDLWRFSAQMMITINAAPDHLSLRIGWSLPTERRSPADIRNELGVIAGELVQRFQTVPIEQRPETFDQLLRLAAGSGGAR